MRRSSCTRKRFDGTGLHIYYVFERPVPLFRNIVEQLEVLKRRLTWQAWTQGASSLHDKVQYESLFQGFRVVGTITKTGGRCRAFHVGEKVTVEYLNRYVPEEYIIRTKDVVQCTIKEGKMSFSIRMTTEERNLAESYARLAEQNRKLYSAWDNCNARTCVPLRPL